MIPVSIPYLGRQQWDPRERIRFECDFMSAAVAQLPASSCQVRTLDSQLVLSARYD